MKASKNKKAGVNPQGTLDAQKQAKVERFSELYKAFREMAINETGLTLAANVNFTADRGLFPTLVLVEITKAPEVDGSPE